VIAKLLDVHRKERTGLPGRGSPGKKADGQQVRSALKTYTSALLVLLGNNKDILLKYMALSENDWIRLWCRVFEYTPEDMQVFDQVMIPAYQQGAFNGLVKTAGLLLFSGLSPQVKGAAGDMEIVQNSLANDVAAIMRFNKEK
jgi:hypothetical protein